jgi:hypothetical protein
MKHILTIGILILSALALAACPAGPPTATPTATMASLSTEIVQLLCEEQSHTDIIRRTTEKDGTVQAWNCREPHVELPRESWGLKTAYCSRVCSGDFSTDWEVYFQIESPTQATAQVCEAANYWIYCSRLRLTRADGRWTAVFEGSYPGGNCDCPTEP